MTYECFVLADILPVLDPQMCYTSHHRHVFSKYGQKCIDLRPANLVC